MAELLERRELLATFQQGDIVIERVGDGTNPLTNTGNAIFLDEYTPSGVLVQQIALPVQGISDNNPILDDGTDPTEGLLSNSADGHYLLLAGYDRFITQTPLVNLPLQSSSAVPRSVATVNALGTINTTTDLNNYASGNSTTPGVPTSVTSTNGTIFWVGGTGTGASGGVSFTILGTPTAASLTSASSPSLLNVNSVGIYNSQLYASSSSTTNYPGVETIGIGLPQGGAAQTITQLPGTTTTSPTSFFLTKLNNPSTPGAPDTLYVADPAVGITKFSFSGTTWVSDGTVGSSGDVYRDLTAVVTGTTVTLYATRGATTAGGGQLVSLTDSSGPGGAFNSATVTPVVIATATANETFRGVALSPTLIPNNPPTITPVNNPAGIPPNSPAQTINLAGISDGDNGTQVVNVTAVSSNPALILNTFSQATATATITGGSVSAITVVNDGSGYTSTPHISLVGGGGSNATATAVLVGDVITAINITNAGSGYTSPPSVIVDPPIATATATASLSGGTVGSITVVNGGIGYTSAPLVTLSGGGGSGAVATAQIANGVVTFISVSGGANYSSAPTVVIAPPAVTGAGALTVNYINQSPTGTLTYTPVPGISGTATITVYVTDNGSTANGGQDQSSISFVVTVNPNNAPTINPISNPVTLTNNFPVPANSPTVSIPLTGITDGDGGVQGLTVTATSSNPSLIPTPAIIYTSPNSTGTLTFAPVPNQTSSAPVTITVTVTDNGGTGGGGVDMTSTTFTVTVTPNHAPTINTIPAPATIPVNSGLQTVQLSGITDGDNGLQFLRITATSNNTALIANPTLSYLSPNTTGTLTYTPVPGASGTATITVVVQDNGGTVGGGVDTFITSFLVTVSTNLVNHAPTINPVTSPAAIPTNAGVQTVNLTGLGIGPGDSGQLLSIIASSSNTALIPTPTVTYTNPNTTGTVTYTPVPNAIGTATITLTLMDNGGTANGGQDTTLATFVVAVNPNKAPTITQNSNVTVGLTSGLVTIPLSGITDGDNDGEAQHLTITATSVNSPANVISAPQVIYSNPNATGSLTFTPAGVAGTATITVTVTDSGGTAFSGVNSITDTFTVTVSNNPGNNAPNIDTPANIAIPVNSGLQTVHLTGIGDANNDGEAQTLTISATSSLTTLISNQSFGVSYTRPSTTGTLSFTPALGQTGTATISVTVTNVSTSTSTTRTFTVTVTPNTAPTLNAITSPTPFNENGTSAPITEPSITLTGITDGESDNEAQSQQLTVTAISDNPTLVQNPNISYTSPNTTGILSYALQPHAIGTAHVTVTVTDNGGTPGVNSVSQVFTVTVNGLNQPPTIDALSNINILENAGMATATAAISGGTVQSLAVSFGGFGYLSSPAPVVTISGGGGTGATATAIVSNGVVTGFTITNPGTGYITAPTVTIANPPQVIQLSGISPGLGDPTSQVVTITATSNNPSVIPNPTVNYTNPNSSGTLSFTPAPFATGTATISVTLMDNGGTLSGGHDTTIVSFTVTVGLVNQAPTISPINNVTVTENTTTVPLPEPAIPLTGITDGLDDSGQSLTVTASSSNPALIPNPAVTYTSPKSTGSLVYSLAPFATGTAVITVTVTDSGGTANGGVNSFSETFTITVTPVNQPPTLNIIPNPGAIFENSPTQNILLSGISAGPGESQVVTVSAVSSNPALIPTSGPGALTVNFTNPGTTGTLSYTPVPFTSGTAVITVVVTDNGGTVGGGINTFQPQLHGGGHADRPTAHARPDRQRHLCRGDGDGDGGGGNQRRFGQRDQRHVRRRRLSVPADGCAARRRGHYPCDGVRQSDQRRGH